MSPHSQTADHGVEAAESVFMMRVFQCFLGLAVLSLVISLGGRQIGQSISRGGHTDDATLHEIVIGNDVLRIPANEIRFEDARRSGLTANLETYLSWPQMAGYSDDARDEFNHAGGRRTIIFVSFRERTMSRDMSGRLAPIYDTLIEKPGTAGPSGLTIHAFRAGSGYLNEVLAVARTGDAAPFVARCLTGATAGLSLAPCERDVHVGGSLSMTFRFSDTLLGDWRRLEQAMRDYARRRIVGPSR